MEYLSVRAPARDDRFSGWEGGSVRDYAFKSDEDGVADLDALPSPLTAPSETVVPPPSPPDAGPEEEEACNAGPAGDPAACRDPMFMYTQGAPQWVQVSWLALAQLACPPDKPTCMPSIRPDPFIANAEYRAGIVRYNLFCLGRAALNAEIQPNSLDFGLFVTATLAHELGHVFDDRSGKTYRNTFCETVPAFVDIQDQHQRRELFGDAFAGCLLAMSSVDDRFMRAVAKGLEVRSSRDYPTVTERSRAVEIGWQRCNGAARPVDVLHRLLQQP